MYFLVDPLWVNSTWNFKKKWEGESKFQSYTLDLSCMAYAHILEDCTLKALPLLTWKLLQSHRVQETGKAIYSHNLFLLQMFLFCAKNTAHFWS